MRVFRACPSSASLTAAAGEFTVFDGAEFPGGREKSREFCRFGRSLRKSTAKTSANSAICERIPYADEQGIFLPAQGINLREQGIRAKSEFCKCSRTVDNKAINRRGIGASSRLCHPRERRRSGPKPCRRIGVWRRCRSIRPAVARPAVPFSREAGSGAREDWWHCRLPVAPPRTARGRVNPIEPSLRATAKQSSLSRGCAAQV